MSSLLETVGKSVRDGIARMRDRPFLEAVMAACALVAMADRDVRLSEQLARDHVLSRLERLRVFDPHVAADLHRSFTDTLRDDPEAGKQRVIARIARFRDDPAAAALILEAGVAIARADSDLSSSEEAVLEELCRTLDLPPDVWLARIREPA